MCEAAHSILENVVQGGEIITRAEREARREATPLLGRSHLSGGRV